MKTRSQATEKRPEQAEQPGLTEPKYVGIINRTGAPMTLTVHWGRDLYAPVKFNTFEVDGPSVTFTVAPDGNVLAQHTQVWAMLKELAEAQFKEKLATYLENIGRAVEATEAARR